MSNRKPSRESREQLLDQIRRLQETVHKLQGGQPGQVKADGLAEGIVSALGKIVPGLGRLIQTAAQTPEFHERLAGIDEEVRRKFKEQPLRQASLGIAGNAGRRQIGIPPAVRRAGMGRPMSNGSGVAKGQPFGKTPSRDKDRPPKVHISPETPTQFPVDVFDEGDKIVVLAEAPRIRAEDVTVSLEGTVLVLSIHAPHRKGLQRIELPCPVTGQPEISLANGVLNIQVNKESEI